MSDLKERILKVAKDDFVRGDDGYWIFWPTDYRGGYPAYMLHTIADELDRLNKDWDKEINEYFDKQDTKDNE